MSDEAICSSSSIRRTVATAHPYPAASDPVRPDAAGESRIDDLEIDGT
jgi:hypothetical protein